MSFVFINILALFPPFLYSLAVPRISPVRGSPVPAASRTIQSFRPSVGDVRKLEFWVHFTHLSTQIGVRFEFVPDKPFFVFNNILASFVLFFFRTPVFPSAGTIALFLVVGSLPTTMCPQNDHSYRLPCLPGIVK